MPLYASFHGKPPAAKAAKLASSAVAGLEQTVSALNEAARLHKVSSDDALQRARDFRALAEEAEQEANEQHAAAVQATQQAERIGALIA